MRKNPGQVGEPRPASAMTIIFFTRLLPNAISDELSRPGYTVHECLAISEVLALAEQHRDAQIVIAADVEPAAAKVIQQHYPTLQITAKVKPPMCCLIWHACPEVEGFNELLGLPGRATETKGIQQCSFSNGFSFQTSI